jgi:hypothetical protein
MPMLEIFQSGEALNKIYEYLYDISIPNVTHIAAIILPLDLIFSHVN